MGEKGEERCGHDRAAAPPTVPGGWHSPLSLGAAPRDVPQHSRTKSQQITITVSITETLCRICA